MCYMGCRYESYGGECIGPKHPPEDAECMKAQLQDMEDEEDE